jgi:hypothetical protein
LRGSTESYAHVHCYHDAHAFTYGDSNGHTNGNTNSDSDCNCNSKSDSYSETCPYAQGASNSAPPALTRHMIPERPRMVRVRSLS